MLIASDIMTTDVITVKKETTLKELARILYQYHINGAPVVDDEGALIGIICESDLIRKDQKLHIPTVVALFDAVFYLESSRNMEKAFWISFGDPPRGGKASGAMAMKPSSPKRLTISLIWVLRPVISWTTTTPGTFSSPSGKTRVAWISPV